MPAQAGIHFDFFVAAVVEKIKMDSRFRGNDVRLRCLGATTRTIEEPCFHSAPTPSTAPASACAAR